MYIRDYTTSISSLWYILLDISLLLPIHLLVDYVLRKETKTLYLKNQLFFLVGTYQRDSQFNFMCVDDEIFSILDQETLVFFPYEYHIPLIQVGTSKYYTRNNKGYYVYLHSINITCRYGKFNVAMFCDPKFYILIYPSQWTMIRIIINIQPKIVDQIDFYDIFL